MMYGSWDIGHNRHIFIFISSYFLPFYPPLNNPENQNFGKMKKTPGGIITPFKREYHKWKSYDVSCLRYGAWQTEFFLILDHFVSFYTPLPSPNNPENQNFQKMKKNPWRYHHFTQVHYKWQSYDIWFLRYEVHQTNFFLSSWPFIIFCPFTCLTTWKMKFKKKMKKMPGDIIILHKCTKNHDHRLYYSWDMASDRCNCYFSFWAIFCLFNHTLLTAEKMKISKKWKKNNGCGSHHFTQLQQKSWSYAILFLTYSTWQM